MSKIPLAVVVDEWARPEDTRGFLSATWGVMLQGMIEINDAQLQLVSHVSPAPVLGLTDGYTAALRDGSTFQIAPGAITVTAW